MTSLLTTAASRGDVDLLVRTLTGEYGEITEDEIKQALLRAACHGKKDCLKILLDYGADPNSVDMDGDTPLMIASSNNHTEVVKLLLETGSDVDSRSDRNRTALHMAVWNNRPKIINLLLKASCDVDIGDRYGDTPLMLSARRGYVDIMKVLLLCGSDVNKKNHENDTALHYASRYGNKACVDLLLLRSPDIDLEAPTIWGFTPLTLSVMNGHSDVALTFIQAGANINVLDRSNKSVLHYAVKKNLAVVVEWLCELGVDVDALDSDGNSALFHSLTGGSEFQMLSMLVKFGANIRVVGRATIGQQYCWCSALEVAIHTGNLNASRLLHAAGCDFQHCLSQLNPDNIQNEVVRKWVQKVKPNPRSLKDACRICVRDSIGLYLKDFVFRLPLPKLLQNFLSFADEDYQDEP